MLKQRCKEGDKIQVGDLVFVIEKIGFIQVHIGIEAPREITITRQGVGVERKIKSTIQNRTTRVRPCSRE